MPYRRLFVTRLAQASLLIAALCTNPVVADNSVFQPSGSASGGVTPASDGDGLGVFGQPYDAAGQPLAEQFQVNTYTTNDQRAPAVAMFPEGDSIVVWESRAQDGAGFGIVAQRFDSNGEPLGTEFQVHTVTSGAQRRPDVAIGPQGDVVVVWDSNDGLAGGTDIIARRFDRDGVPVSPEFRVNSLLADSQRLPRVAASAGGFVVAWEDTAQDETNLGVSARRFDTTGEALGVEFAVHTYTGGGQRRPAVAAHADGAFVVTWDGAGQDGSGRGIFARRFESGGAAVEDEFRVNTYTTGGQTTAAVATDGSGGFVVTWQSAGEDGSGLGVFSQRYDAAGTAVGDEFQVNSFTTSDQMAPGVAALPSGSFVVAWSSFGQDGESNGIFAQRYDDGGDRVGTEYRVSTTAIGNQTATTIGAAADRVVVAWHSRPHCSGDCNDNGEVTINELVRSVSIVLGRQDAEECRAIDPDGNQTVTIAELVRGVNSVLDGCPAA